MFRIFLKACPEAREHLKLHYGENARKDHPALNDPYTYTTSVTHSNLALSCLSKNILPFIVQPIDLFAFLYHHVCLLEVGREPHYV